MEDKILVNLSTDANHTFECPTNIIGREGEGYTSRFEITIPEKFTGCSVYLDFEKPNGEKLRTPKLNMENGVAVYDVHPYLLTDDGEIKAQAVLIAENGQTWKSSKKKYHIQKSINAIEEIPDKEDFIADVLSDVLSNVTNAIKGKASGGIVAMSDISPLKHTLDVRARSKNLINIPTLYVTGDGTLKKLYEIITPIKCGGENTVLSCKAEYGNDVNVSDNGANLVYANIRYANGAVGNIPLFKNSQGNYGGNTEILPTINNGDIVQITIFQHQRLTSGSVTIKDIQLEIGTVATEYTPCIPDISSVKVKKLGKNLFNDVAFYESNGWSYDESTQAWLGATKNVIVFENKARVSGAFTIQTEAMNTVADKKAIYFFITYTDGSTQYLIGHMINSDNMAFYSAQTNANKIVDNIKWSFATAGNFYVRNTMISYSDSSSEYEPYIEPVEYAVNEDGAVKGVLPIYPTTTLMTDTAGAVIDVEYNKDINKAFAELYNAIISLGGNV